MNERKKIIEKFITADYIDQKIEDKIIEVGVLTGSYAFDCVTEGSDIDIILKYDEEIHQECYKNCFYTGIQYPYQDSINFYVKFRSYSCPVNVIFFHQEDFYEIWKLASENFIKVINESEFFANLIKDRYSRVIIFESFKEATKVQLYNSRKESKNV